MRASSTVLKSVAVRALLLWLPLQLSVGETIVDHPPVLEGSSLTLVCSGKTSSSSRSIYWWLGQASKIATCHSSDDNCMLHDDSRYKVNVTHKDTTFTGTLTLKNISRSDLNTVYRCQIFDDGLNKSYNFSSWNISKIFYAPEKLSCTAKQFYGTRVNVTCNTIKVYPGIICEFFQIHGGSETSPKVVTNVAYTNEQVGDRNRYYSASCSSTVSVSGPGKYMYRVRILTGDDNNVETTASDICTNEIVIAKGKEQVVIEQREASCSDKEELLLFQCIAFWVTKDLQFIWFLDDVSMTATESQGKNLNEVEKYVSDFKIPKSNITKQHILKCVGSFVAEPTRNISDTKHLDSAVLHSHPPFFSLDNKTLPSSRLRVREGQLLNELACQVNSSRQIKSLHILCHVKGRNQTIIDQTDYKKSVSISKVHLNNTEEIFCLCYVNYTDKCYNSNVSLSFLADNSYSMKYQPANKKYTIMYIVGAFLLIFFIIFLLGIFMYLRSKWDELYTYVYIKFYSSNDYTDISTSSGLYGRLREFVMSRTYSFRSGDQGRGDPYVDAEIEVTFQQMTGTIYVNAVQTDTELEAADDPPLPPPPPLPPRVVLKNSEPNAPGSSHDICMRPPTPCKIKVDKNGYLVPRRSTAKQKHRRKQSDGLHDLMRARNTVRTLHQNTCIPPENEYLQIVAETVQRNGFSKVEDNYGLGKPFKYGNTERNSTAESLNMTLPIRNC